MHSVVCYVMLTALEHAEAEQGAMQEQSKRADKGGGGLRMAVCVLYMCVSQVHA